MIPTPTISFDLGRTSEWQGSFNSSVEIGGYDSKTYNGSNIFYLESFSDKFWAPIANGIYYDGIVVDPIDTNPSKEDLVKGEYKKAILDTGSPLMVLPAKVMARLHKTWDAHMNSLGCSGHKNKYGVYIIQDCSCWKVHEEFKNIEILLDNSINLKLQPKNYLIDLSGNQDVCVVGMMNLPSDLAH